MTYKYIIHVSDIHIRHEVDRFDEYVSVFNNTFNSIRKCISKHKCLIICTGDIIHNRTKITPCVLYLVNMFLEGLSTIGEVVVIDGNHDIIVGNEVDKRLLEVVKKPQNVTYISRTGEYIFDNVTIGASTLVDNNFIKYEDIKNKQNMTIAIGHFTLKEWLEERKFPTTTRVKSVEDFRGYKHVLLGDIHSRKRYGNCTYSGSLISQNFSEIGKHGYSLLDITKDKWKGIDVHSEYSFVNLRVNDDGILSHITTKRSSKVLDASLKRELFTTHSYIKLFIQPKYIDRDMEYRREISRFTNIKRFIKHVNNRIMTETDTTSECTIGDREITSSPLNEEEIIKSIIGNDSRIIDLHQKFKGGGSDYTQNVTKWYLKKLSYENILKYRGTHTLHFNELDGIIGISGLNAAGKSSLLKILIFGLSGEISVDFALISSDFSKTSQSYNHYKFDNVNMLNYDLPVVKRGFIEIEFIYGELDYRIHRFIERKGSMLSTNTTLSQLTEGEWKIICSSLPKHKSRITEKDVNKKIYNMIGRSSDLFLLNVVNKNSGSIVDIGDVGRFNIFSNLFNLNNYNDIATRVKARIQEVKGEIQKHNGKREFVSSVHVECGTNSKDTNTNTDMDALRSIKVKKTEKKILETIKNNTVSPKVSPRLLECSSEELKIQFDSLVLTKNKLLKQLEGNIPEGETIKPDPTLSHRHIIETYRELRGVVVKRVPILNISHLPKPCKTDITESEIDKSNTELLKYNYDIERVLESETKLLATLGKFNKKMIYTGPDTKKIDLNYTKFDINPKRESFDSSVMGSINDSDIIELINEKSKIEILALREIHSKRNNEDKYDDLQKRLTGSMKDVRKLTSIDDIIISLQAGKIKESHIKRLNGLGNIETVLLKVCDNVSEINKRQRNLENDTRYDEQVDSDIEFNREMNKKILREREISTIIDEYNKMLHNKELDQLNPLFEEINRRLSYIKLYRNYEDLKHKFLQNVSYLVQQNELCEKKKLFESYIRYYNNKLQRDIEEIDHLFSDINHTVNVRVDILHNEIGKLLDKIEANKNMKVIDTNLNALHEEQEILNIYSKLVKEDIKITILSRYLTQVVEFINDVLVNLVNFTINLVVSADTNDKSNKIRLNIVRNNTTGAHSLSAYEEFVLNLVSKIVLNIYNNNATATFLVLDECLECVDCENIHKINNLLNMIKQKYQHILLITHIEEYYHMCDKKIMVTNGKFELS